MYGARFDMESAEVEVDENLERVKIKPHTPLIII